MGTFAWRRLMMALFFAAAGQSYGRFAFSLPSFESVNGEQNIGPSFVVTYPSVIESGSSAKLCASLVNPNETLTMTVFLLDEKDASTTLVQQSSQTDMHRCFNFQAPIVSGELVQRVRVVVQGRSFKMIEERKVMFRSYLPSTFIQTDKPLYNPGQTVNFRIVTLDTDLVPLDQLYSRVVLLDLNNIQIGQWTNVSSTKWILELSFDLNLEVQVGIYTLKAFVDDRESFQVFEVKKYVLPKFDISLKVPQVYSVGDLGLKVEACAKYTYGQPVPGKTLVEVCREPYSYGQVPGMTTVCLNKTVQLNDTGCASLVLSTSVFFTTKFENNMQDSFLFNVTVIEEGTDVVMSKSANVYITFEIGEVRFVQLPDVFNYNSTLAGKVSATYFNGTPIASKDVFILDISQWPNKLLLNLTTNQNGSATFSLNTASFPKAGLNLMASATPQAIYGYKSPYFSMDSRVVSLVQADSQDIPGFSDLTFKDLEQPLKCGASYPVSITYLFIGETGDYTVDIVYMVLSRGVIVLHGFQKIQAESSNAVTSGSVMFDMVVSVDMAPVVQLLAFCVLPSQNILAGRASFETEACFMNKVSLQFSSSTSVPAEANVLTISALAGSLCGLSAVDRSVLIMDSGRRLTPQSILNLLPVQSLSEYPPGVEDEQECLTIRSRRAVAGGQAYEMFKSFGMMVATNLPFRPPQCLNYRYLNYYRTFRNVFYKSEPSARVSAGAEATGSDVAFTTDVTVRTYFPEAWIWQLAQVGPSGKTQVAVTVPDTITTWETGAFCLSPKGIGLAPSAVLTVFQPFFLELTLPYSIIRGESLELKATVYNYLSQCIMVQVSPTLSSNFTLQSLSGSYSSCVCANGRKTFKWTLKASVLGKLNITVIAQSKSSQVSCGNEAVLPSRERMDVVTQNIIVLPEGVERTFTQNWLFCPKGSVLSEDVTVVFPKDLVQGSARCFVSVLGDIIGRALQNIDQLLQMPSGCGEQNMIILAPNIYILKYLEVTAQLTAAIQETAIVYLQNGYQGQLNYRHSDGSYSTFGYDESNTWLTTFVLRSFGLAKDHIFIDPNVIQSAKDWLISKQGSDGCFMQQGTLYHNDMKGGVGDNVTMTGYIVASLLELGVPATDSVIINGLSCLRPLLGNLGNTYTTALLAYTFSLAGESSTRSQLLNALNNVAISEGSKLHWSQTPSGDTLAVEISSYVLLAVLSVQPLTASNLGYANRVVSWLVTQQNPFGGFSSTQDTVVALHALSLYATKVFTLVGSSTVTVQSTKGGEVHSFAVNRGNRLLYQENSLKNVPGKFTVSTKGSTCASVQVACFYNIPTPIMFPKTLSVEVKVTGDCKAPVLNLLLNFTVKYSGPKKTTNMVLVDVKLLSGFTADTSLLGSPDSFAPLVQRVDAEDDHVLIYLKEVPKGVPMSYRMQLRRVAAVWNLKPGVVNVYDYYRTTDDFEASYTSPCL